MIHIKQKQLTVQGRSESPTKGQLFTLQKLMNIGIKPNGITEGSELGPFYYLNVFMNDI